jgi:carbonic anhydrase
MNPIVKCVRGALIGTIAAGAFATAWAEEGAHHWTYKGTTGPTHWAKLEDDFATCQLGKHQSPIDIRKSAVRKADLAPIEFNYKPSALKIIDNGHTIQVNYEPGSTITVGGQTYELVQFHFHKPSEEKIDGKSFDMVAHLVHKNAEGKLAVVAVLIRNGQANPLIHTLWRNLPTEKGVERAAEGVNIDVSTLLPPKRSYYTFAGSLTTPPCSEEVTWLVLRNPVHLSGEQIARFGKIYPMNARPTQPLNGRVVEASR